MLITCLEIDTPRALRGAARRKFNDHSQAYSAIVEIVRSDSIEVSIYRTSCVDTFALIVTKGSESTDYDALNRAVERIRAACMEHPDPIPTTRRYTIDIPTPGNKDHTPAQRVLIGVAAAAELTKDYLDAARAGEDARARRAQLEGAQAVIQSVSEAIDKTFATAEAGMKA